MTDEELRQYLGVLHFLDHPYFECLQAPHEEEAGERSGNVPQEGPGPLHLVDKSLASQDGTGNEVGMPADVFGEGVDDQIGTVFQRVLKDRAEEGVVHGQDHLTLRGTELPGDLSACLNVHQVVGGIGGGLHEDHPQPFPAIYPGQDLP